MRAMTEVFEFTSSHRYAARLWPLAALTLLLGGCGGSSGAPDLSATAGPDATNADPPRLSSGAGPSSNAASGGALDIIVAPDASGALPGDLWVGCRSGPRFQVADLERIVPLDETDPGGVSDAIATFLGGGEGQHWPQQNWLILRQTEDEILLVHEAAGAVSFMTASRVNGAWSWSGAQGGGSCPLYYVVPDELNAVDWRLDPAVAPLAGATTLDVLVTERECVSGAVIGGRLRGPQVVMTERAVRIAFAAVPPAGNAFDCPSNPESLVTVQLPEPLGDREIVEGLAIGVDLESYLP